MILANFFGWGQPGYFILMGAVLLLLLAASLWKPKPRDERDLRGRLLGEKYRTMTQALLRGTADDELLDAVIANLHEKLDPKRPDPYRTIPLLSPGRCAVYFVWLITKELDEGSFEDLYARPSGAFVELSADGMARIGAARSEQLLRRSVELAGTKDAADSEAFAQLHADFLEAVEQEKPLALCAAYIRENPSEFLDEGTEEAPDGPDEPADGDIDIEAEAAKRTASAPDNARNSQEVVGGKSKSSPDKDEDDGT